MNFLRALTMETQVCIALVLVLLIMVASGIIGYRIGWERAVEYLMKLYKIPGINC